MEQARLTNSYQGDCHGLEKSVIIWNSLVVNICLLRFQKYLQNLQGLHKPKCGRDAPCNFVTFKEPVEN